MNIKIRKVREDARKPERATDLADGYDVFASIVLDKFEPDEAIGELPVEIPPGETILIGVGVQMAVPWLWQCGVHPRSGLAAQYGIAILNSPGMVDPDYRGEVGVLLINHSKKTFTVEKGMRIAQLVFHEVKIPVLEEVEELPLTVRGAGGFGSTGLFDIGQGTVEYQRKIAELDQFYMGIALLVAGRSRCVRGVPRDDNGNYLRDEQGNFIGQTRRFGCIIVKDGNITSMGYNAQYQGSPVCSEVGCLRDAEGIPSGTRIERCRAMHAEWWALSNLVASGISAKGATVYLNSEPCEVCAKLIAQTGVDTVVLLEGAYPTNGTAIVREAGINVRYVTVEG